MNDLYSDVSKIPDSEQHRLQCVLEDILINVPDCPQWVLDIHGAIMRHLDTQQPPTEHTDMTEDAYDLDFTGYDDDEDSFEAMLSRCGMMRDGYCSLAGSEYCEWECRIPELDLDDEESE